MPYTASFWALALTLASTAFCAPKPHPPPWDGVFQKVPTRAKADNTYYEDPGAPVTSRYYLDEAPLSKSDVPAEYQSRAQDIPFTALVKGSLNFFTGTQNFNQPSAAQTNVWRPDKNDRASNSACGIPDNAYNGSKAAIHPYWLKFVPPGLFSQGPLERMCQQDICISLWNETGFEGGKTDIMVKVTDICSTDPSDPAYCPDPSHIMIDRIRGYQLYHHTPRAKGGPEDQALRSGSRYPRPVWWFFSKCFQDGLPHKGYNHSSNWFADPPLRNNWNQFAIPASVEQAGKNAESYARAGLPGYAMGGWLTSEEKRVKARFDVLSDWKKGGWERKWCPVAGGTARFGQPPEGSQCVAQGEDVATS